MSTYLSTACSPLQRTVETWWATHRLLWKRSSFSLSPLTTEGRFIEGKLHVHLPLKAPSLWSTIRVYDNTQLRACISLSAVDCPWHWSECGTCSDYTWIVCVLSEIWLVFLFFTLSALGLCTSSFWSHRMTHPSCSCLAHPRGGQAVADAMDDVDFCVVKVAACILSSVGAPSTVSRGICSLPHHHLPAQKWTHQGGWGGVPWGTRPQLQRNGWVGVGAIVEGNQFVACVWKRIHKFTEQCASALITSISKIRLKSVHSQTQMMSWSLVCAWKQQLTAPLFLLENWHQRLKILEVWHQQGACSGIFQTAGLFRCPCFCFTKFTKQGACALF